MHIFMSNNRKRFITSAIFFKFGCLHKSFHFVNGATGTKIEEKNIQNRIKYDWYESIFVKRRNVNFL